MVFTYLFIEKSEANVTLITLRDGCAIIGAANFITNRTKATDKVTY